MNSNSAFNGDRLKKARTYRGLTIADLANKVAYQRQTLSMYENKKIMNPDEDVIGKIAIELGFPLKYFYEKSSSLNIGSTYFRALRTTNKKYRNEQVQKMELLSEIYSFLKDYIEFPENQLPSMNDKTPQIAAKNLRDYWNLGSKPIENIIFEVESRGIFVTSFETQTDSIDAFSQMVTFEDGIDSVFLIGYSSNKTSAARLHFDIAHELGHICLHEWSEDIEALSKDEFKERESEANEFASAFLLPEDSFYFDVKQSPKSIPHYIQLKKKWKVSISAMIRRSYSLNLISYDEYQNLMRILQRRGMRKEEPLDDTLVTAKPSILKTSVQMLLGENIFTPKQFMNELSYTYNISLNPQEVEHLLDLPKDILKIDNVIPIHNLKIVK